MHPIEPLHRETIHLWLVEHLGPPTSEVGPTFFWQVRGRDGSARFTVRWDSADGRLQAWDTTTYRSVPFESLPELATLIAQATAETQKPEPPGA